MTATASDVTERRRSVRLPRRWWLGVGVLLGVLLLVAQNSTVTIDSYGLVDARTVAMRVAVAPCSWTRVTSVAETPTEVRVEIQTWPCPIPGPGTASLVARDVVLALRDPLGARTVVNEQGRRVAARAGG